MSDLVKFTPKQRKFHSLTKSKRGRPPTPEPVPGYFIPHSFSQILKYSTSMKFLRILSSVAENAIDIVASTSGPISIIIEGGEPGTRSDVSSILADFITRSSKGNTVVAIQGQHAISPATEIVIFTSIPDGVVVSKPSIKLKITKLPSWVLFALKIILPSITFLNPNK